MYILGVLLFFFISCFCFNIEGGYISNVISPTGILLVLGSVAAIIVATKSYSDLINGIKLVIRKTHSMTEPELNKAIRSYNMYMKASIAGGLLGLVMGSIHILGDLSDVTVLGPKLAAALDSVLYGIILAYFIFMPIKNSLENHSADRRRERMKSSL